MVGLPGVGEHVAKYMCTKLDNVSSIRLALLSLLSPVIKLDCYFPKSSKLIRHPHVLFSPRPLSLILEGCKLSLLWDFLQTCNQAWDCVPLRVFGLFSSTRLGSEMGSNRVGLTYPSKKKKEKEKRKSDCYLTVIESYTS